MERSIRDGLAQLEAVNERAIRAAGPRYTPGVDPGAPNIEIRYLLEAFDALSLVEAWRARTLDLARTLNTSLEHRAHTLDRLFRRRKASPARLLEQIEELQSLRDPADVRTATSLLRRNAARVTQHLQAEVNALRGQARELDDASREERDRLESEARALSDVMASTQELLAYLDGPPGQLLRTTQGLLLLGSWGTGKTHLLCDIARQRLRTGAPALLLLASSLPDNAHLTDSIATASGLADSGAELFAELNRLGQATGTRALILIDAMNEGDREAWREQLANLARTVSRWPNVALVVSCRRPFNEAIVTDRAAKQLVPLEHYGFENQEFDAQLEYFGFYDLPAPSVPLITPEFSRPLFLKILCESIKDLSRRSQRQKLREVASGQKGMTYVLEYYTKKVGRSIEDDLSLPVGSCWQALKGTRTTVGIAGAMATQASDWLRADEAATTLQTSLSLTRQQAENVLDRLIHDGLLAEEVRWRNGQAVDGVQFAYQRFGDHVIARHLLDACLATNSEATIRRCFFGNRPLGRPFQVDRWGHQFRAPGIASAIMLEFPERMKRSQLPHELFHYLPRRAKLVAPIKDVFLDGLYWRSAEAFTDLTDRMVGFLLTQVDEFARNDTFEVLVGLATRPAHPYSAERLARYLASQPMSERDETWSEYLRFSDEQSNVQRILAWAERTTESEASAVQNEIRLASLFLTTTDRPVRDRATRALVLRGAARPDVLFDEALRSLEFNDPYVSERMLAAAYGVAMRFWADPDGDRLRQAIVPFARALVRAMFVADAPHSTKHVLCRGYALGVIALARRIDSHAIATRHVALLNAQFDQIPSPFVDPAHIQEAEVQDCLDAMHMDFANYTLGHLFPNRRNYDDSHPGYQDVRRQIARRMSDLGYSNTTFGEIDRSIARTQPLARGADGGKTDRYGKKYSWIAYFEMYGVRSDLDLLAERRSRERTSDCDVDPSFPPHPREWVPPLGNVFAGTPTEHGSWLADGPDPLYRHLLSQPVVDGISSSAPWVLLSGFVQQSGSHDREIFTFVRGLLLQESMISRIRDVMADLERLDDSLAPGAGEDYYTYAGEIPWSPLYGSDFRLASGGARRHLSPVMERFSEGRWRNSGRVEVPVHRWVWESYHSSLNDVSGIEFPAPYLCEKLGLTGRNDSLDLWDQAGQQASLYREFDVADQFGKSRLMYLRQDLLERYLAVTDQVLVWIVWGERTLNYRLFSDHRQQSASVNAALQGGRNVFGSLVEYATLEAEHGSIPA